MPIDWTWEFTTKKIPQGNVFYVTFRNSFLFSLPLWKIRPIAFCLFFSSDPSRRLLSSLGSRLRKSGVTLWQKNQREKQHSLKGTMLDVCGVWLACLISAEASQLRNYFQTTDMEAVGVLVIFLAITTIWLYAVKSMNF